MKILLLVVGKTSNQYLRKEIKTYQERLKHYISFSIAEIPDIKNRKSLSISEQKKKEANLILEKVKIGDQLILLDEKGKECDSIEFSKKIQKKMNAGTKRLVFLVGGSYGFDHYFANHFKEKISLSRMTFSHQMVRLFIVEQIYRSMTILKNEPYHHD